MTPSLPAPVLPKLGDGRGSSFLGSCFGFSSFFASTTFSLVRFNAGAAGCGAPNAVLPPAEAPNANAGLLLTVLALNVSPVLLGSEVPLVELSAFGIAWIVVLPKPNTADFAVGSWFSLSFEETAEEA